MKNHVCQQLFADGKGLYMAWNPNEPDNYAWLSSECKKANGVREYLDSVREEGYLEGKEDGYTEGEKDGTLLGALITLAFGTICTLIFNISKFAYKKIQQRKALKQQQKKLAAQAAALCDQGTVTDDSVHPDLQPEGV